MTKTKYLNLNKKNTANYTPLLSLDKARHSYFIHERQVHSVESAPASAFKAAIRAHLDLTNIQQEATDVLNGIDDVYARWWLVCYCAKSMKLFVSREDAEYFLQSTVSTRE